jgi:hypothetical protein
MSFRRDGNVAHEERQLWDAWKLANADILPLCGLPLGAIRSPRDWNYLLQNGYWCANHYGEHVGNIDFDLAELNPSEKEAFRLLPERTLSEQEKQHGCAAWHFVHPPKLP